MDLGGRGTFPSKSEGAVVAAPHWEQGGWGLSEGDTRTKGGCIQNEGIEAWVPNKYGWWGHKVRAGRGEACTKYGVLLGRAKREADWEGDREGKKTYGQRKIISSTHVLFFRVEMKESVMN
eukprot:756543-Hanusia_phi.AAC.4